MVSRNNRLCGVFISSPCSPLIGRYLSPFILLGRASHHLHNIHYLLTLITWRFSLTVLSWLTPKSNNAESRAFINTFRCFVLCWLDNLCHTVLKSFCLLMFAQLSIYHAKASSLWCSVDVGSFFPGNEFCLAFITGFMLPSCRLPCEALFLQVLIFFCLHFRYWISVTLYMALSV